MGCEDHAGTQMKCAGCQGALWLYLGLGAEFQVQLLREQHIVLMQQVRDVAASAHVPAPHPAVSGCGIAGVTEEGAGGR